MIDAMIALAEARQASQSLEDKPIIDETDSASEVEPIPVNQGLHRDPWIETNKPKDAELFQATVGRVLPFGQRIHKSMSRSQLKRVLLMTAKAVRRGSATMRDALVEYTVGEAKPQPSQGPYIEEKRLTAARIREGLRSGPEIPLDLIVQLKKSPAKAARVVIDDLERNLASTTGGETELIRITAESIKLLDAIGNQVSRNPNRHPLMQTELRRRSAA